MMRRWLGVAVFAGCLGLVQAVQAQLPPAPYGPYSPHPLPPEPVPVGSAAAPTADPGPNLVPGPLTPQMAPHGPPDDLSLPNDAAGAFPTQTPQAEEACYFAIGYQGFWRQGLNRNNSIAVLDPQNLDTGVAPPAGQPVFQRFDDLRTPFQSGVRSTLGYLIGDGQAVEMSGLYIIQQKAAVSTTDPGRIDAPFVNPPLGFEGDNGLWLQADRLTTTFTSTFWNVELNGRWNNPGIGGTDLLAGLRFADLTETLSTYTDDDGVQFPMTNGQPDPLRVATYKVRTKNQLLGPQLGFECAKSCSPYITIGCGAKAVLGADFIELNRKLVRGDGFVGFDATTNTIQLAQLYELNVFVDILPLERVKLHLGYSAMWMLDVANVVGQYDFNLRDTTGLDNRSGSIFFHGPVVELQFLF